MKNSEKKPNGRSDITPTPDFDGSEKEEAVDVRMVRLLLLDLEHEVSQLRDLQSLAVSLVTRGWHR